MVQKHALKLEKVGDTEKEKVRDTPRVVSCLNVFVHLNQMCVEFRVTSKNVLIKYNGSSLLLLPFTVAV